MFTISQKLHYNRQLSVKQAHPLAPTAYVYLTEIVMNQSFLQNPTPRIF